MGKRGKGKGKEREKKGKRQIFCSVRLSISSPSSSFCPLRASGPGRPVPAHRNQHIPHRVSTVPSEEGRRESNIRGAKRERKKKKKEGRGKKGGKRRGTHTPTMRCILPPPDLTRSYAAAVFAGSGARCWRPGPATRRGPRRRGGGEKKKKKKREKDGASHF